MYDLVGWQARLSWNPSKEQQRQGISKYFTMPGMRKSEHLYNRDLSREHDITVIVEGVTDVHRVGPQAVALFGKVPSTRQTQLFRNVFGHNIGIMLLDSDAGEEAEEYVKKYSKGLFNGGLHLVRLPEGDPASHDNDVPRTRQELWDIIISQLQGVL